jgi:hypothetical protein
MMKTNQLKSYGLIVVGLGTMMAVWLLAGRLHSTWAIALAAGLVVLGGLTIIMGTDFFLQSRHNTKEDDRR